MPNQMWSNPLWQPLVNKTAAESSFTVYTALYADGNLWRYSHFKLGSVSSMTVTLGKRIENGLYFVCTNKGCCLQAVITDKMLVGIFSPILSEISLLQISLK